ncbi:hypothetical protein F511_03158 [Dorcoceras hygrometricum]|nr:hypothetical protein F511_03158 [Dorcoceras hygrometricum]
MLLELILQLQHMEQKLEELLNAVMTTCRPMRPNEKQQLCKRIKELPPRNVDRVVEILGHGKTLRKDLCSEVHVDLDGELNQPVPQHPLVGCIFFAKLGGDISWYRR